MKEAQKPQKKTYSFRIDPKLIDPIIQDYLEKNPDCLSQSEALLALITKAGSALTSAEPSVRAEPSTTTEPVSSEKGFECECPFGDYMPAQNKVHCRSQLKAIKDWLPKNRLVDPEICDKCFTGLDYGTYGGFLVWKEKQKALDKKRDQPSTPPKVEHSRYPPKSWFSGWEYDNIPCSKADNTPLMCIETCFDSCDQFQRKECLSFMKFRASMKAKGEWIYERKEKTDSFTSR